MTQEIKTEKFEGLLVKVPEADAYGFRISYGSYVVLSWKHKSKSSDSYRITDNTSEKWKIIGNPFELSEEECISILGDQHYNEVLGYYLPVFGYWGYKYYKTAIEALNTLLKSLQVYKENPYGNLFMRDEDAGSYKETELYPRWKIAQERTGSWILIQKIGQNTLKD